MTRQYIQCISPEKLVVKKDVLARPGNEEVMINVAFAGINRADVLQRLGLYPAPPDASPILGLEVSGVISAVGNSVSNFTVGQRVCALVHGGGYADKAIARAEHCLALSRNIDFRSGAALPEALLTVWYNLFERANLQSDETVLIHGGISGIGNIAVQLAVARGCRVLATAGTASKCKQLYDFGAEFVANYRDNSLSDQFGNKDYMGSINVVFDLVGGDITSFNISALSIDGRLSLIGLVRGISATIDLTPLLMKRLTIIGSTVRRLSLEEKRKSFENVRSEVMPLITSGAIKPLIDSTFPLSQALEAHHRMLSGKHAGKLLLDCRSD